MTTKEYGRMIAGKKFYTVLEVSEILVQTTISVKNAISQGLLNATKVKDNYMISEQSLKQFQIEQQKEFEIDREKLQNLLNEMFKFGWAVELAREIESQIIDNNLNQLTETTYKRLSRWVNPYRNSDREQTIQPIAEQISVVLFGYPIGRSN